MTKEINIKCKFKCENNYGLLHLENNSEWTADCGVDKCSTSFYTRLHF